MTKFPVDAISCAEIGEAAFDVELQASARCEERLHGRVLFDQFAADRVDDAAVPTGLACDFFGQPLGPMFSRVAGAQVTKPGVVAASCRPRQVEVDVRQLRHHATGGFGPSDRVFASMAAPAPRMSPVPRKPGIGTALAMSVTVGQGPAMLHVDADETAGRLKTAKPSKARQVDALRIRFSLLYLMDRSASIRVAPEPCRSGDIEISGDPRRRTVAIFHQEH